MESRATAHLPGGATESANQPARTSAMIFGRWLRQPGNCSQETAATGEASLDSTRLREVRQAESYDLTRVVRRVPPFNFARSRAAESIHSAACRRIHHRFVPGFLHLRLAGVLIKRPSDEHTPYNQSSYHLRIHVSRGGLRPRK